MPPRTESEEEEEELIDDENKCKICMLDVDDERVVNLVDIYIARRVFSDG